MQVRSYFGLLLAAALVPVLATPSRAENVRITVTGTITSADAGMGYSVGQPVSFFWDVNDYAPQTPRGQTSSVEYKWDQETAGSEPKLFANVGGTGIGGTYQEGPGSVPWDRLRVRPTGSSNNFEVLMRTDSFDTTTNNHGIFLTANPLFLIDGLYFDGAINSPFPSSIFVSSGPLPNPTTFLDDYYGTYDVTGQSSSGAQVIANDGTTTLTANFSASSVSLAAAPVPEPSTYVMALAGLACGGYLVRRCRKRA